MIKRWVFAAACFALALMSCFHGHIFSVGWDYDINFGIITAACAGFAIAFLLDSRKSKMTKAGTAVLAIAICAFAFSWAELLTEFMPSTSSKGWGIIWFVMAIIAGCAGLLVGLATSWVASKLIKQKDP